MCRWRTGHTRRALKDANLARDIFRELRDPAKEAAALDRLGLILWTLSDYRAALAYFGEAGDIYRLACFLLSREKLVHRPLRLLGLGVSALREMSGQQLPLF